MNIPDPVVDHFIEFINHVLEYWYQKNIDGGELPEYTTQNIRGVFGELMPLPVVHSHNDKNWVYIKDFQRVAGEFRRKKKRATFKDFSREEIRELIATLAPLFTPKE